MAMCTPHHHTNHYRTTCGHTTHAQLGMPHTQIQKASVNKLKIIAGWYAVVIGLVLIIVGKPSDSAEAGTPTDDNGYMRRLAEQSTSELMMMIAGIILILVGAFHILYPVRCQRRTPLDRAPIHPAVSTIRLTPFVPLPCQCVHRTYTITLKLMRESPAPTACFGIIKLPAPTIKLTVDGQPDDNFIIGTCTRVVVGNEYRKQTHTLYQPGYMLA